MGAFVVREVKDGRQGEPAITRERKHFSKIHESDSLAGPDGFRLQETVWSQLRGVGGSTQEFVRSSL